MFMTYIYNMNEIKPFIHLLEDDKCTLNIMFNEEGNIKIPNTDTFYPHLTPPSRYLSVNDDDKVIISEDPFIRSKWKLINSHNDYFDLKRDKGNNEINSSLNYLGIFNDNFYMFYIPCKWTKCRYINNTLIFKRKKPKSNDESKSKNNESNESKKNKDNKELKMYKDLNIFTFNPNFIPFNIKQSIKVNNYFLTLNIKRKSSIYIYDVNLYYKYTGENNQKWYIKFIDNNIFVIYSSCKELENKKYLSYNIHSGTFNIISKIEKSLWKYNIKENDKYEITYFNNENNNKKLRIAVLIRGFINKSFDNDLLYKFVESIYKKYNGNVTLFVHTWYINNPDKLNRKTYEVKKKKIQDYFKDLICETNIIIDTNNLLYKKIVGKFYLHYWHGKMPLLLWKYMWWGINRGVNKINEVFYPPLSSLSPPLPSPPPSPPPLVSIIDDTIQESKYVDIVVNMRFDLLTMEKEKIDYLEKDNYISLIDDLIKTNYDIKFYNPESSTITNFYVCNLQSLTLLSNNFNTKMDDILYNLPKERNQEKIVYLYAKQLLDYVN